MGITFRESDKIFKLDTPHSTYMLCIADEEGFVMHLYYGKRLGNFEVGDLCRLSEYPFVPSNNNRDRVSFLDCGYFEYPTHGLGDFRDDSFRVQTANGHTATSLLYKSHRIYRGKPALEGLPATFGGEEECETLELVCEDEHLGIEATLIYTVFEDCDAITRSVKIKNVGLAGPALGDGSTGTIKLTKVLSASIDMDNEDYDTIVLRGSWARERVIDREHLGFGKHYVSSLRGESSHQEHPFIALASHNATQDEGEVYGFNFVYSGNFIAQAERSQFDSVRVSIGINPVDFCWNLKVGEEFTAPEAVCVYSGEGIGHMSRTFHDLYRNHLIRSPYKDKRRPVLINNWEATYFNFDTDKLLSIANQASKLGIEMLVMDDGWFGHRDDDESSLGDWFVNEKKLKGGLKHLVDEVNKLGMKFGIWFEPEMVSPDSLLYSEHQDWAIQIPGRRGSLARQEYVLDLSRPEVVDYVFNQVKTILESANIEYVKWDMNRPLTDLGSSCLDSESQGELFHRYVLGVYELQERLITEFPNLLLENCSGGGARFDPGMLYYSPQIWCSDDTDAIERLRIQEGTALIYPLSTMGAHVSDCPNHVVGRVTPFETRGYVALAGTFGYELDVTRIPEADREMIPSQVAMYHKYNDLVRTGDYYRIASFNDNHEFDCWAVVAKDKREALITVIEVLHRPNYKSRRIKLKGLDSDRVYIIEGTGERMRGDALMYAGISAGSFRGDFGGRIIHLIEG